MASFALTEGMAGAGVAEREEEPYSERRYSSMSPEAGGAEAQVLGGVFE
jgi:hypothetical protein